MAFESIYDSAYGGSASVRSTTFRVVTSCERYASFSPKISGLSGTQQKYVIIAYCIPKALFKVSAL